MSQHFQHLFPYRFQTETINDSLAFSISKLKYENLQLHKQVDGLMAANQASRKSREFQQDPSPERRGGSKPRAASLALRVIRSAVLGSISMLICWAIVTAITVPDEASTTWRQKAPTGRGSDVASEVVYIAAALVPLVLFLCGGRSSYTWLLPVAVSVAASTCLLVAAGAVGARSLPSLRYQIIFASWTSILTQNSRVLEIADRHISLCRVSSALVIWIVKVLLLQLVALVTLISIAQFSTHEVFASQLSEYAFPQFVPLPGVAFFEQLWALWNQGLPEKCSRFHEALSTCGQEGLVNQYHFFGSAIISALLLMTFAVQAWSQAVLLNFPRPWGWAQSLQAMAAFCTAGASLGLQRCSNTHVACCESKAFRFITQWVVAVGLLCTTQALVFKGMPDGGWRQVAISAACLVSPQSILLAFAGSYLCAVLIGS
jgi:hypothetical protein